MIQISGLYLLLVTKDKILKTQEKYQNTILTPITKTVLETDNKTRKLSPRRYQNQNPNQLNFETVSSPLVVVPLYITSECDSYV